VLNRAIKLLPYDALLYRLLGATYIGLHDSAGAGALLDRAIELFPQDSLLRKLRQEAEAAGTNPGPAVR
jgi:Flp pilus assembly protein TadD